MHKSRVVVNSEKMSKSLGNFFTVTDLVDKGFTPEAIRFTFLSAHYRSKLNFTEDQLMESQKTIDKFNDLIQAVVKTEVKNIEDGISAIVDTARHRFEDGMDDDLNISVALASLFGFIKTVRKKIDCGELSEKGRGEVLAFLKSINEVFMVFDFEEKKGKQFSEDEQKLIDELIEKRNIFRTEKNWAEADRIRDELLKMGVNVADKK